MIYFANGLSFPVEVFISYYSLIVFLDCILVLTPVNISAVSSIRTELFDYASLTSLSQIAFDQIMALRAVFLVPVSVTGELVPLWTSIRVAFFIVDELIQVVVWSRSYGSFDKLPVGYQRSNVILLAAPELFSVEGPMRL